MDRQPLRDRLRGWFHLVRTEGWLRSWKLWPRFLRLALRGSPRYHVYAVAAGVFADLASRLPGEGEPATDPKALVRGAELPVAPPRDPEDGSGGWRRAAGDVLWNYERFLMSTRS
jgi:hypothetical protein